MAFDVTPASGVGPYVLAASFTNKNSIDGNNYALEARSTTLEGECYVGVSDGNNSFNIASNLFDTGTYTLTAVVSPLYCRVISLIIRNVKTGLVVDYKNVEIDNT